VHSFIEGTERESELIFNNIWKKLSIDLALLPITYKLNSFEFVYNWLSRLVEGRNYWKFT
jgi:hypothetical protein